MKPLKRDQKLFELFDRRDELKKKEQELTADYRRIDAAVKKAAPNLQSVIGPARVNHPEHPAYKAALKEHGYQEYHEAYEALMDRFDTNERAIARIVPQTLAGISKLIDWLTIDWTQDIYGSADNGCREKILRNISAGLRTISNPAEIRKAA